MCHGGDFTDGNGTGGESNPAAEPAIGFPFFLPNPNP
jgi:hypothetical protein